MADLSNSFCRASVSRQWEVGICGIQRNEPLALQCPACKKVIELSSSCQQTLSNHTKQLLLQYDKRKCDISIKFMAGYQDHTITSLSFNENKARSLATLSMKHDFWGWRPQSCTHEVFVTPPLPLRLFRTTSSGDRADKLIKMRCITCLSFERIERLLQHHGYFTPFKHLHLQFWNDSSHDAVVSTDEELKTVLQECVQHSTTEWEERSWNMCWIKNETVIQTWGDYNLPTISIEPISSPMGPFLVPRDIDS